MQKQKQTGWMKQTKQAGRPVRPIKALLLLLLLLLPFVFFVFVLDDRFFSIFCKRCAFFHEARFAHALARLINALLSRSFSFCFGIIFSRFTNDVSLPRHVFCATALRLLLCTCCFAHAALHTPRRRSSGAGAGGDGGGKGPQDKFSLAMDRLHVTAVPKSLPCRTEERNVLLNFLKSNIKSGAQRPLWSVQAPFSTAVYMYLTCTLTPSVLSPR